MRVQPALQGADGDRTSNSVNRNPKAGLPGSDSGLGVKPNAMAVRLGSGEWTEDAVHDQKSTFDDDGLAGVVVGHGDHPRPVGPGQTGPRTADRPRTGTLGCQDPLSDEDLLGLGGTVGVRGVGTAAEGDPGRVSELHPAVEAVAGTDSPVATGLTGGDKIPDGGG